MSDKATQFRDDKYDFVRPYMLVGRHHTKNRRKTEINYKQKLTLKKKQ